MMENPKITEEPRTLWNRIGAGFNYFLYIGCSLAAIWYGIFYLDSFVSYILIVGGAFIVILFATQYKKLVANVFGKSKEVVTGKLTLKKKEKGAKSSTYYFYLDEYVYYPSAWDYQQYFEGDILQIKKTKFGNHTFDIRKLEQD